MTPRNPTDFGVPPDSQFDAVQLRKIAAYDAARAEVKIDGNTRAYYVLRAQASEELLADAQSALVYIERRYGRLDGVGWDRVLP